MSEYEAPLWDMRFVLEHIADLPALATLPGCDHAQPAVVEELLEHAARFMREVVSPLNTVGDQHGSRLENGEVRTPPGFREAYQAFVEAGWGAVALAADHGGAGLPYTIGVAVTEMLASANMAFGLCPALSEGAIEALGDHGAKELQDLFLAKLVSGKWSATMDLTEPQAGSDLGAIRTTAVRQPDGTYRIRGSKVFITYGDHDLTENIVHLVLARTPDAPPGTRGISCFIVPKFLVAADGSLGARNDLTVVSLEHKVGIHASPTCTMSYGDREGATGYLIGEENQGLQYMFTMMNRERIFVGTQGLGVAQRAYQRALAYAKERRQGRAPGAELAGGAQSPIIDHPDVRRMLLTMKAQIEAMRCVAYATASFIDIARLHPDPAERRRASARAALLTPVAKAWLSDLGVEVASLGVQVHGGVGYVEETGCAQHLRDARIAPIYEGTNGIQAADLVLRKLPMEDGAVVRGWLDELRSLDAELGAEGEALAGLRPGLASGALQLSLATESLLRQASKSPRAAAAGATPYLRMFGFVAGAYYLARSALVARRRELAGIDPELHAAKLATARFFVEQLLPPALALLPAASAGAEPLFAIGADRL